MADDFVLGKDCKALRNTGTYAVPVWVAVDVIKDLTLNVEAGEWDASRRGTGGWEQTARTLKKASIDSELIFIKGDAGYEAIRDAFFTGTSGIDMAIATGPIATIGTEVFRAEMDVFKFTRKEPLTEGVAFDISIKPRPSVNAPTYYEVAA